MRDRLIDAIHRLLLDSMVEVEADDNGSHVATGAVVVPLEDIVQLARAVRVPLRPDLAPGAQVADEQVLYSADWL